MGWGYVDIDPQYIVVSFDRLAKPGHDYFIRTCFSSGVFGEQTAARQVHRKEDLKRRFKKKEKFSGSTSTQANRKKHRQTSGDESHGKHGKEYRR